MEAINYLTGPGNKFGGGKEQGADFVLKLSFVKPINIAGYALRTADVGLDPEEWSIVVDQTDGETETVVANGIEIDKQRSHRSNGKWELS